MFIRLWRLSRTRPPCQRSLNGREESGSNRWTYSASPAEWKLLFRATIPFVSAYASRTQINASGGRDIFIVCTAISPGAQIESANPPPSSYSSSPARVYTRVVFIYQFLRSFYSPFVIVFSHEKALYPCSRLASRVRTIGTIIRDSVDDF